MFVAQVNLEDRVDMVSSLRSRFRYFTRSAWEKTTSYTHDLTHRYLDFTAEDCAMVKAFLTAECKEHDTAIRDVVTEFEQTGYSIVFNGSENQYAVLCKLGTNRIGKPMVWTSIGIDEAQDFSVWTDEAIRNRIKLLEEFDRACNKIVELMLYYAKNTKIKEVTEVVKTVKKIAVLKEV